MNVYVDFDSTLSKSTGSWVEYVSEEYASPGLTMKDVRTYHYITEYYGGETMDWWKDKANYTPELMGLLDGAKEFFEELQRWMNKDRVHIATYSFPEIERVKTDLIMQLLDIKKENIIHSKKKWEHTYNGILIDDNINNCVIHHSVSNMPAILFNLDEQFPWANGDIMREICPTVPYCTSYVEVHDMVKRITYGRSRD